MTAKERAFCYYYANGESAEKSVIKAGYIGRHEEIAMNLLLKDEVNNFIEKLYDQKRKNLLNRAYSGYERLAFGEVNNVVKLICLKNILEEELNVTDFFNISEIKKSKDGALEVKFFDKIKALEKLEHANFDNRNQEFSFYNALEKSAGELNFSENG